MIRVTPALLLALALPLAPASRAAGQFPELGLQTHYALWEGPYTSHGVGGRFRWEPLTWLGVDGTFEALVSETSVDIPIGFQLYAPWELVSGFRARALAGLCSMLSLARGQTPHSSDADDIRFGFKVGAGLEYALGDGWTIFSDIALQRYFGHSREVSVWSDALDGEIVTIDRFTFALGLGVGL